MIDFEVNGAPVSVADDGSTLLEALRDDLGITSPKDGCSPQGQCGCCTVWVDGRPRVACVTPLRRVAGRAVTTVEGLTEADDWAAAFCASGASQCGFCTPGIIMRLAALDDADQLDRGAIDKALLAHLCRCTGWQTVVEATIARAGGASQWPNGQGRRDDAAAARRADVEGHTPQDVSGSVALGRGGFADDTAPDDALVAVRSARGDWVVGPSLREARTLAGKVQGRRTTAPVRWPVELPAGEWERTLQTTWVEPGYLEPDASWCRPGGEPAGALGNGGAFGGKSDSTVGAAARRLADQHGVPVRALFSREDVVRFGPKRPPVAIGLRADGSGRMRLAKPDDAGDAERMRTAIGTIAPHLDVEFVDVSGPRCSADLRAAGWAEAMVALSSLRPGRDEVVAPNGSVAEALYDRREGMIRVTARGGTVLDEIVARSFCVGAAHMAFGWVTSEALAVGDDGDPLDLRSARSASSARSTRRTSTSRSSTTRVRR